MSREDYLINLLREFNHSLKCIEESKLAILEDRFKNKKLEMSISIEEEYFTNDFMVSRNLTLMFLEKEYSRIKELKLLACEELWTLIGGKSNE